MPKHEGNKPRIATAAKLARHTHEKPKENRAVSDKHVRDKKK